MRDIIPTDRVHSHLLDPPSDMNDTRVADVEPTCDNHGLLSRCPARQCGYVRWRPCHSPPLNASLPLHCIRGGGESFCAEDADTTPTASALCGTAPTPPRNLSSNPG